ncbi:prolyl oligopeptidase [Tessaracoccus bendigoensis DSM 12906]|uniref:Prolyl oligopeptidase n=1 Tax=Tessaracoccus bendigoensis DSM 12906 TaxID=1123357 RepID=A0A1M6ADY2_9ACTN|nr:prolyl oligopeptidase family serine peptidase [Tessaracoccus bendigoensis]SHI34611.1 prolyl oligopeptidase [Tessaracoccus bendigoensis DSM 12906]
MDERDEYLWLEDVEGEAALDWVRARNAESEAQLADTVEFARLEAELLAIYDSDRQLPMIGKHGKWYYNFWRDADHPRGIWRRTTLDEYRLAEPTWQTVLDLDALNEAEGENWVWHGAEFLRPEAPRVLVALSRGGADADVTREFDVEACAFVEDGFVRPESKGSLTWRDQDSVFLVADLGPGTVNRAGYARTARIWRRGTPMSEATVVFEGPEDNAGYGIFAGRDRTPGFIRDLLVHYLDSRDAVLYIGDAADRLVRVDVPDSAVKHVHREWLVVELRDEWSVGDQTHPAGSLLVTDLDDFLAGGRDLAVLFTPTETSALAEVTFTRNHMLLNVLTDVVSSLTVATHVDGDWQTRPLDGVPELGTLHAGAVDDETSDEIWLVVTDYLTPTSLLLSDLSGDDPPELIKAEPAAFDATGLSARQRFATSDDGTRVPYFLIGPADLEPDGSHPTLLYGYGGFEISLTPAYAAAVGKGWLERGGVYAVANIRGGGEYGPRWHQAALRENRHRAYEDFEAVARDLIDTGITSPTHLAIRGGSNGGLLTGNMLVRTPELFGAVVIQVPLLDMRRYTHLLAGASWMGEYGDPDVESDWKFIRTFSPYHLIDAARGYPPTLLLTSTRDDRVHPGHARKMMAALAEAGKEVSYFENIEGGHGGAADNRQRAHMDAIWLGFLWRHLG